MQLSTVEFENGIKLIKLSGVLDVMGASIVDKKLSGHCAGNGLLVILDLSEVTFLASIGIRLIMQTARSVAKRDGKLVVLNPHPDVKKVLELAGVSEVIPIYSDLNQAASRLLQVEWRS